MSTTILTAEDCQPVPGSKEFGYYCPCSAMLFSDQHLVCPYCGTEYIWPETRGYKKLLRAKKAKEADIKAKQKAENQPEHVKTVLALARDGVADLTTVYVATFLTQKDQERRSDGHTVPTEMQVLSGGNPEVVVQLARELHDAGERGRGLIVHLCNKLKGGYTGKKPDTNKEPVQDDMWV